MSENAFVIETEQGLYYANFTCFSCGEPFVKNLVDAGFYEEEEAEEIALKIKKDSGFETSVVKIKIQRVEK